MSKPKDYTTKLTSLPPEVMITIFSYCKHEHKYKLKYVCREFAFVHSLFTHNKPRCISIGFMGPHNSGKTTTLGYIMDIKGGYLQTLRMKNYNRRIKRKKYNDKKIGLLKRIKELKVAEREAYLLYERYGAVLDSRMEEEDVKRTIQLKRWSMGLYSRDKLNCLSILDLPGHESQYKNMLRGLAQCDVCGYMYIPIYFI